MAETLKDRFLLTALSPLSILLKVTGVFVNPYPDSQWKRHLYRFWTFFMLILFFQSNVYIYLKRTLINEFVFANQQIKIDRFIRVTMNELHRFSSLVSDTIVHLSLVFKIWPSVALFLETLECIDVNFERPNLSPIKRYSLFGLIYILLTAALNVMCAVYWDLLHPTRLTNWLGIFENSMRNFSNHGFTVIPVWVFIVCGQLYLFYARKLMAKLNSLYFLARNARGFQNHMITRRTFAVLRSLKQLYLAADLLHRHFSTILMVNCYITFIRMLTSVYFAIEFFPSGYVIVVFWDASDTVESFIRFWLICHTSDQIRNTTTECISVLRSLRDSRNVEAFRESNKITLYIIEISQMAKNLERHSLKGILPLSKRLIIPALETIFTYLLIIYQFKNSAQ